jgi:KaiC/GvpD/RAD55 family RecA-like ATPase
MALATDDLSTVIDRGIEPEHFADDEVREVYTWAFDFYAEHHQPPSMDAVSSVFPHFKARISKDPLPFHVDQFVLKVKERLANELLRDYFEHLEDPESIGEIEIHAAAMADNLIDVVPMPRASYLGRDAIKRFHRYKERQQKGDHPGIYIGIPSYDKLMQGLQPHEMLAYAGPPGSGKTTSMQHSSVYIYLHENGTLLFVSLEVEGEQILRRFETMLSHVEYAALKGLELIPEQEAAWLKVLERCQKESVDKEIIIRDDIINCTAEKIATQRIRFKPDVVVVDYLEEMRGRKGLSGWENVQENARQLKQQARVSRIPVITATQVNVTTGETSYQSIRKLADCIIQLIPAGDKHDEDMQVAEDEMGYVMLKYRDGPSARRTKMKWSLNTMDIEEIGISALFPTMPLSERKKRNRAAKKLGMQKYDQNPWARKLNQNGRNIWVPSRLS